VVIRIIFGRQFLLYITLLSASTILSITTLSFAHPYLPLTSGSTKTYDYHFHIEKAQIASKLNDVRGEIFLRFDISEEKYGRLYLRQSSTYHNIPFWKSEVHSWRRDDNGDIYLAWIANGKWNEALELPKDVPLGREWDYNDGQNSKRKITKIFDLTLLNGKVLPDCLEITNISATKEKLKFNQKSFYCRDVGDAGSEYRQQTPVGEYITETNLKEFEPAK
jgi:hypothetical protein